MGDSSSGAANAVSDILIIMSKEKNIEIIFFIRIAFSFHKKLGARDLFSLTPIMTTKTTFL
jgi:hypothetical protein